MKHLLRAFFILLTVSAILGGLTACGEVSVTGVTLDKTEQALTVGQATTLSATVAPSDATNKSVTWSSSDPSVASVIGGAVIAHKEGTATVMVTTEDGGFTASCTVTVKRIPAEGVTLSKTEAYLETGEYIILTATVSPLGATNNGVTFSVSDESVASVDQSGRVTAVGNGTATVTVTTVDGGFTASCEITVTTPVSGVSLSESSVTLPLGSTHQLTATVSPELSSSKAVRFSSSDTSLVTVSEDGIVTALKKGTATVTVTTVDGGFTASCTVTVTVPATAVTLNKTSAQIYVGSTEILTATLKPTGASADKLQWSSSDTSVASVDTYGRVTAKKAGTATITVTVNGTLTASCSVTVSIKAVESVSLDRTSISLDNGASARLTATVTPQDASDKTLTWSSSNTAVVTVTNGTLKAVGVGTATVTVRSSNGKTAVCTVTVNEVAVSYERTVSDKLALVPASGSTKDGATATFWHANKSGNNKAFNLGREYDLYEYETLTFRVYSEAATGSDVMIRFDCPADMKPAGAGMDPYYRLTFTVDFTGWKTFSVNIHDMKNNHSPSWKRIVKVVFNSTGWGMDEKANENTKLYFTDIAFEKYEYKLNITGSKTEAEYLSDVIGNWRASMIGSAPQQNQLYISRINSIHNSAMNAWKNASYSYTKTFKGTGTDKEGTLFNKKPGKAYGQEDDVGDVYIHIQQMALGYATPGTTCYKDPELLTAIKNSLEYAYNNYYGASHLTDAAMQKWVADTNWWWWQIGIPSYVIDILMLIKDDLTDAEIEKYLTPVDYFVPRISMTACNRLWLGKVYIGSALLQGETVKALRGIEDLYQIFDLVTYGDGFYADGSFIQHGDHPYTGGYGASLLDELTQFMLLLDGTIFNFDNRSDVLYNWLFESFEPLMVNKNFMACVKGREVVRGTEYATFTKIFACFTRAAYFADGENKQRLESIIKYFLVKDGDSIITATVPTDILDYVLSLKTDPSVKARDGYEIFKVYASMDRTVSQRPDYAVAFALSSTRIFKYEAINKENMHGWYQGDGMVYIYTPGYDFDNNFFNNADPYKMPGTTVVGAQRKEDNMNGKTSIYGSSDFVGGVSDGKFGVTAMILGYKQNDWFNTDLSAKKTYFAFDDEIICIGSAIKQSTYANEVYTTVENRYIRSGDVFKVDGQSATSGSKNARYAHFTNMGGYVFDGNQTVKYAVKGSFLEITLSHGVRPTNGEYFFIYLPTATEAETKAYSDNMSARIEVISRSGSVHAVKDKDLGITAYAFYEAGSCNGVTVSAPCTLMISGGKLFVSAPTQTLTSLTVTVNGTNYLFDLTGNVGGTYEKALS